MKRLKRWGFALVVLGVLAFVAASWIYAERLTRARPCPVGAPPQDFPYPIESVSLSTSDGQTLSGWYVPAPTSDRAIVLLHGFGGNRKQMTPRAKYFRELGYAVLLYDARASGESTGDSISFGYRERADLVAAVAHVKSRGADKIVCLGHSQGGATIAFAADELNIQGAVVEAVYDEMSNAVDRRLRRYLGVPGWLGGCLLVPFAERRLNLSIDDIRPVACIGKLRCPVFVVSGANDDRAWPADTERLFNAAAEPKELWMVPHEGHHDLFHVPEYRGKVASFLQRYVP